MEQPKLPMVYMIWRDAMSTGGWIDEDEIEDLLSITMLHESVGFVLKEDQDEIVLVSTRHMDDEHVGDMFRIPAETVVTKIYLTLPTQLI